MQHVTVIGYNGSKYLSYFAFIGKGMDYSQCDQWNPTKRDDPLGEIDRANARNAENNQSTSLHVHTCMGT